MHTKDILADALIAAGLPDMAAKARTGWYHDYLSPLDTPAVTLADDLAVAAKYYPDNADAILKLRKRHINGDFDATTEESEEWAASEEGQDTMRSLLHKR